MTPTDKHLYALIKAGDTLITAHGQYEAESGVSVRNGTNYQHCIVPVYGRCCILPFNTSQINAVYRNGECLFERGVSVVQKELFSHLDPHEK